MWVWQPHRHGSSALCGGATTGATGPRLVWAAPGSVDIESVTAAWQIRGRPADLADVNGAWAVALHDPRTGDHVIAADPVGVQPLYWARTTDGGIAVASWLAHLVDRDDVDDTLDYDGVVIATALHCHGPGSLEVTQFTAVRKLPYGTALLIRPDGSVTSERFWDPHQLPGPDASLTPQDCADLLRERIDAAVRRLTPTDRPVGAHVSGGLDCTAVACRANQVLCEAAGGLVAGYSWAPSYELAPRFAGDERALQDDVQAAEGFPIRLLPSDRTGDWWWPLDHARYPQSTHVRERWVLPQAQADGVRVMLTGWGGDELASFNGRNAMATLLRRGRLTQVWRESARRSEVARGRPGPKATVRSFATEVLAALPAKVRDLRQPGLVADLRVNDAEIDAVLRAFSPRAADLRLARLDDLAARRSPRDLQLELLTDGHLQHRTAGWYQTGRLFGIDYRYPLLDLGVVEAALRLPWWAWRGDGWTRIAFRRAVAGWVPSSVAWNVTKAEPAQFAPPGVVPTLRRGTPAPPRPHRDDPRYLDAVRAAARSHRTPEPPMDLTGGVRAAAPPA